MKILSLLLLLISFQAFAGHDFQYSIKYPDGRVETKEVKDSEGFFVHVGEHLCSVSEIEEDDESYEVRCLDPKGNGSIMGLPKPEGREDYTRVSDIISDNKDKMYQIEILAFSYFSKKVRKPFSDDSSSREY